MAGSAANAWQTSSTARDATRAGVLAAGATADARDAAGAARPATRPVVLAAGSAVAIGVAAAATRVVLEDDVGGRRARHCRGGRKTIRSGHRCSSDRSSNGAADHQWFQEGQFR
ncbi:hypothetical protein AWC29_02435 [Mycobacterium triplex]|uniref:Uncharacterized protein n=1 Tax=Mycobacterium triplex TaxID=47839 RepID=A0ABX3W0A3_9MYCO|nr:hypothetical protein AWC29_02435 [Mycobacterium triplex]